MINARHLKNSRGENTFVSISARSSCVRTRGTLSSRASCLDHVPDVEVPPRHVLAPAMMLRIMREVGGTLVISCARGWARHIQAHTFE